MFAKKSSRALVVALIVAFAFFWPFVYQSKFLLSVATLIALNVIGALSVHLVIRTGQISLGHAAFMGIGSYSCVLSVMKLGFPTWAGLLFGMACSATLALLIGPVVLRVMGKYFVLVTFLLGEIVRLVFVEWVSVTGGSNGIFGIPPIHPLLSAPVAIYYFILVVSLAVIWLCARIFASETGRAIESSRQALHVAEASGIPVMRLHVGVFVLSAALVGLQGGLLAFFLEYIDPDTFGMTASLNFVVMNVIGGMYNMIGPIIGAVFLVALPEMLRSYVELQQIIFGVVLIIVMAFFSGGIVNVYAIVKGRLAKEG